MSSATAIAHPNIAFIKYWGVRNADINLPASGSLSMTLGGLETRTTVTFDDGFTKDAFELDGFPADSEATARVSAHLDRLRSIGQVSSRARVVSHNTFPTSAGIASSASGFAALTVAGAAAIDLDLSPKELSILARKGSGSAARSIFGGFVAWHRGDDDTSSFAEQLLPPEHWRLVDWIAVVDSSSKATGSTHGHRLAESSPLQSARVASAPDRLAECQSALAEKDFGRLATVIELDSLMMHAVMMTSSPPLLYWAPGSVGLMNAVRTWRADGMDVCATLDAGANVHCITTSEDADKVEALIRSQEGVLDILRGTPGPGARLSEVHQAE